MSCVRTPRSAARARSICTRSSGLSSFSVMSASTMPSLRRASGAAPRRTPPASSSSGPRMTNSISALPPPMLNDWMLRTAVRRSRVLAACPAGSAASRRAGCSCPGTPSSGSRRSSPVHQPAEREHALLVRRDAHVEPARVDGAEEAAADRRQHGAHAGESGGCRARSSRMMSSIAARLVPSGAVMLHLELGLVDVARHELLLHQRVQRVAGRRSRADRSTVTAVRCRSAQPAPACSRRRCGGRTPARDAACVVPAGRVVARGTAARSSSASA